jgi:hypothetical protein
MRLAYSLIAKGCTLADEHVLEQHDETERPILLYSSCSVHINHPQTAHNVIDELNKSKFLVSSSSDLLVCIRHWFTPRCTDFCPWQNHGNDLPTI